jgi:hypothetical protein
MLLQLQPTIYIPVDAGTGKDRYAVQNIVLETGGFVRGTPIAWNDERIPETVYHVTTNYAAVLCDGLLRAGGVGGLGGDSRDRIVSLTISPSIAANLQSDIALLARLAGTVGAEPNRSSPERITWGRQLAGLLKAEARACGWTCYLNIFDEAEATLMTQQGYSVEWTPSAEDWSYAEKSFSDWTRWFFLERATSGNGKNPIFISPEASTWSQVDPTNVRVVAIAKASLNTGALITDFDLSQNHLEEIRIYGDLPTTP